LGKVEPAPIALPPFIPYNSNFIPLVSLPPPSPKQTRIIWLALTGLAVAVIVGLIVALFWGLGRALNLLSPVLWPIAVAGVLAYLLDPVVDFLESKKVPRTRSIIMVFLCTVMLLLALLGSVVPQLVSETSELVQRIPDYAQRTQTSVVNWIKNPPAPLRKFLENRLPGDKTTNSLPATNLVVEATNAALVRTNLVTSTNTTTSTTNAAFQWAGLFDEKTIGSTAHWLAEQLPQVGKWLASKLSKVTALFGILAGLALIPVYLFYLLLEKRGIESHWSDYLPLADSRTKDEAVFIIKSINNHLIAFFRGQVLVAVCDGIAYTIGFLIIGLPYAILLGVMATGLTMIPFLGAIATCAAALVIALVQFGDWQHPLLVLAVFGVVQTLEGFVFQPKILGDRVGLHPLTIIIAVMVGTTVLGGILGGILAIPLTAAGKVLMERYVWKGKAAK
jgi:predicted PurR-regulated permease PerM